jgi:hypothetical protein
MSEGTISDNNYSDSEISLEIDNYPQKNNNLTKNNLNNISFISSSNKNSGPSSIH